MISAISTSSRYILQPSLLSRHKATVEWLSATVLWMRELNFFQKLLDQYSHAATSASAKQKVDHFQSMITFYRDELIISLSKKLREHELRLANMLESRDETKVDYYSEHDSLMNELEAAGAQLSEYKHELFEFIEDLMR